MINVNAEKVRWSKCTRICKRHSFCLWNYITWHTTLLTVQWYILYYTTLTIFINISIKKYHIKGIFWSIMYRILHNIVDDVIIIISIYGLKCLKVNYIINKFKYLIYKAKSTRENDINYSVKYILTHKINKTDFIITLLIVN
jgi:hypothetical protein